MAFKHVDGSEATASADRKLTAAQQQAADLLDVSLLSLIQPENCRAATTVQNHCRRFQQFADFFKLFLKDFVPLRAPSFRARKEVKRTQENSGKEKTHKHKQICGIVPGLGGCQKFVYVFFAGHSLWRRKNT